jgi:3-hydroxy-3-methylglutaryl CoA synthase
VGRYRESYPQYFAVLPDVLAEAIEFVIIGDVLSSRELEPSEEDIRDLCLAAARRIITEEQFDRALDRARSGT